MEFWSFKAGKKRQAEVGKVGKLKRERGSESEEEKRGTRKSRDREIATGGKGKKKERIYNGEECNKETEIRERTDKGSKGRNERGRKTGKEKEMK